MKRYGLRSTGETDIHDYFDKVLSRKGAAPATGRDTLIKLQGRVARKLDTHASENRLAGLPTRITRITVSHHQMRWNSAMSQHGHMGAHIVERDQRHF